MTDLAEARPGLRRLPATLGRRLALPRDRYALLLLGLLVLLFFAPAAALRGVFFFGDATDYFARVSYSAARLRAGQVPLWNPYLSLGGSHAADPAALAWYPVHLLLFVLLPAPVAYNYDVLLHVWLAASGTFLLARQWAQTRAAALLAGIVYAFSGFAVAHLQHLNILIALAWLPWLFLCIERFLDTRRSLYLALGSLALALQILGGHTQIVLYGGLALGAYVLIRLVRFWRGGEAGRAARGALGFLALSAAALGLAAVLLAPLLELLNFTTRSGGVTFDYATTFSLVPERLVAFAFPFFFGGSFWRAESGAGSLIEMSGYVGLLALALAALAVTRRNWRALFLAALAAVALLLALGRYTPLYNLVFQLPLLRSVRAPARWLALVTFALALLAGWGLDALRTGAARPRLRATVGVLLLLALAAVAVGLAPRLGVRLPNSLRAFSPANPDTLAALAFILGAAGLLALWARGLFSERTRLALTLALAAVDLFFFSANLVYNQVTSPDVYTVPSAGVAQVLADSGARVYYWADGETKLASYLQQRHPNAYVELSRDGLRQSLPMDFGVSALQGYGTEPPAYSDWLNAVESRTSFDATAARLIGLYSGWYVLTQSQLDEADLRLMLRAGRVNVYRNYAATPRVIVVSHALVVPDQGAALDAIQRADFDPLHEVVLEAPAPAQSKAILSSPSRDVGGRAPAQSKDAGAAIRLYRPERVVVDASLDTAGYLVLNDTFYPGWRATVDGHPAPIYRANALVRAVPIGAGAHTVEFLYDPPSVKVGAAISALTLLAWVFFLARTWRR